MELREEAVAGAFYPAKKEALESQLDEFFSKAKKPDFKSNAIIVPHAGYIYSGRVAAAGFSALKKADTFVILSPNHTGIGSRISISKASAWSTPLGNVKVNEKLSRKIAQKGAGRLDDGAHFQEHSIEVQLPFLQRLFGGDFSIVAVTISTQDFASLKALGDIIFELGKKEKIALIASSDFTHFEHLDSAKKKDLEAIKLIEKTDLDGFHRLVLEKGLSICGAVAIEALLQYCARKGIREGSLLQYDTSASASGDDMSVVGYAALAFK